MEEILLQVPYLKDGLVVVGTMTVVMTGMVPVLKKLVEVTETDKDDKLLAKFLHSRVWRVLGPLKRFSLI